MLRKICLILVIGCVSVGGQAASPNVDLFRAIADEDYKGVVTAVERGADVNIRRKKDGVTPLIASSRLDNVKIMEYLLSKGADVNARDKRGFSALHNVSIADSRGENPLHGIEMAQLLLKAKANVYLIEKQDFTPLLWSAYMGRNKMVRVLGKAGAVNFQNRDGWTPLMKAAAEGHTQTVRILLELGANPNMKSNINATALSWAVYEGHTEVVKVLLQGGAVGSLHVVDSDGYTPLSLANQKGYKDIAALLRKAGAVR